MNISYLKKELHDDNITPCQKEAVHIEINMLHEKTSELLKDITRIDLEMQDAIISRNDILFDKLHNERTELYNLLLGIQ